MKHLWDFFAENLVWNMNIMQVFTLLGALGMFLYGMNLMSSGLQKAAGDRLRGLLSAMTSNPFKGLDVIAAKKLLNLSPAAFCSPELIRFIP